MSLYNNAHPREKHASQYLLESVHQFQKHTEIWLDIQILQ